MHASQKFGRRGGINPSYTPKADAASELSHTTQEAAIAGAQQVSKTAQAVEKLSGIIHTATDNIGALADSSQDITRAVGEIRSIAEQTGRRGGINPSYTLALMGFFLSRYMAAYQLGHIDGLWDPLFTGAGAGEPGLTGSEAVTTSDVSEAFPISDAGLGAILYALEVLLGLLGSTQRWRTQPWVVVSFGILIVPLGVVSITFIIIQPIIIGTWCLLCLIAAALMLIQIAYAFNEFVATGQFLRRRKRAGAPVLKVFFVGDTDEGRPESVQENFQRSPLCMLRDALVTGVNAPWNLALCVLIGLWLMSTRIGLGHEGAMAHWDHVIGALLITVAVIAMAESARMVRFLMIPVVAVLLITPFVYGVGATSTVVSLITAVAVIALAVRRGPIHGRYGTWNRYLV